MTDEQLELVIEKALPELRIALKALLTGELAHAFDIAGGVNGQGQRSKIVCFLAHEAPAAIMEGAVRGMEEANKITMRLMGGGPAS